MENDEKYKDKAIRLYDSLYSPDTRSLNDLELFMKEECMFKRHEIFDTECWKKEIMCNIPLQENVYDCGVFSCMYAEFASRNRPMAFTQQNMEYFRLRMVYEICTGELLQATGGDLEVLHAEVEHDYA